MVQQFVKEIISNQVLAGEEFPNDLEIKSHRLKNVVRKCVSEYMNADMVSTNRITNVLDVTDTSKCYRLNGKILEGYVQSFQVLFSIFVRK
jgi:hypothetical protein